MQLSFWLFFALFLLVGGLSVLHARSTREDYYLASRTMPAWLVGLSAVATNNSGYMFIGVMGYTYVTGLASAWLMVGWILGDLMASLLVHERLRRAAEDCDEVSYAGVLSPWGGTRSATLQRVVAAISLLFMLTYASAQLLAGGKALQVLFDWPLWGGAVLGCLVMAVYCFAGGIRASIWTDAAQSTVMVVAMATLLFSGVAALGGPAATIADMSAVEGFLDPFPPDLLLPGIAGAVLFAVGWMFAGISVIGQPQVMVRFMTLRGGSFWRVRAWYYGWFTAFYAMATGVGMLSRVYLADPGSFDAELALPMMAMQLLPEVLVGLVLAGIFAATMSTADSLLLASSAAVTHDLLPQRIERPLLLTATTLMMAGVALALALSGSDSVFDIVIMSWSGMASAFGPLLLLFAMGRRPTEAQSLTILACGLGVALVWRWLGWQDSVYEGMPGILGGLLIGLALCRRGGSARTVVAPSNSA
jgi:Na+/proline symporter